MSTVAFYGLSVDDRVRSAALSGTAPSTSYALDTLKTGEPGARVLWGSGSATITATFAGAELCDELIIPCANLDPGDDVTSVLHVTNGAGLDLAVPVRALPDDGIPLSIALDLKAAEPNATLRTSNVWHLVITSNSAPVLLGGMIGLYGPQRSLDTLEWDFTYRVRAAVSDVPNDYLTRYRLTRQTLVRELTATILVDAATGELAALERWFRAQCASVYPVLFWPIDDGLDAYIGTWQPTFEAKRVQGSTSYTVTITFTELSKGLPVL